jgi:hypothetical protein
VQPTILLWELSHRLRSGVTLAEVRGLRASPVRVELYRGWVHAIDWFPVKWTMGPAPVRGEEQLRLLLKRDDVDWRYDDKLPLLQRGAVTPFHPAAVIRNALEVDGDAFRARAAAARLQIVTPPHPSCIGIDEKPLVAFLAAPRSLAEVDAARLCLPARATRLLAFLEAVGALRVDGELGLAAAYAALELGEGAAPEEVKRAYRRLARALHPDAHPGASADELRELERRFAAVSAAYRRLV